MVRHLVGEIAQDSTINGSVHFTPTCWVTGYPSYQTPLSLYDCRDSRLCYHNSHEQQAQKNPRSYLH